MIVTRKELSFDYYWRASSVGNDPDIGHRLGDGMFNKDQGYEVLGVINAVGKTHHIPKLTLREIEEYIRYWLPGHLSRGEAIEKIEQRFFESFASWREFSLSDH